MFVLAAMALMSFAVPAMAQVKGDIDYISPYCYFRAMVVLVLATPAALVRAPSWQTE